MSPSLLLEASVREIERRGWCQGSTQDAQGRVCMVGAMFAVLTCDPNIVPCGLLWTLYFDATKYLCRVINVRADASAMGLTHWQDDAARTVQDVTRVMLEASNLAKENHQ